MKCVSAVRLGIPVGHTYLHQQLEPCDPLKGQDEEGGEGQAPHTRVLLQGGHGVPERLVSFSVDIFMLIS